jgi:periplasmic protein TonB
MASAEKLAQAIPETLPEDFSEWDNEGSPAARPVDVRGVKTSNVFGAATKPPALSAEPPVIAAPKSDALRRGPAPLPGPGRLEYEFLRSAAPESQVVAMLRTDVWRNKPSPVRASVPVDYEALRPAPRVNGSALDHHPGAASRGQVTARAFKDVSSSPPLPGGVVVEELRYAPEPTPLAARVNEEDFLQKLKAIDAAYHSQPATTSQRTTAARGMSEVSVAPAVSNGAVEPMHIIEPVKKTPTIETDDEISFLSFHSDLDDLGDEDPNRKKWVMIGAASFATLVLLVFVGPRLLHPAKHALAAQSAELRPAAAVLDPAAKAPKPSPSTTLAEGPASATAETGQALITQPAANVEETILPKADSELASITHGTILTPPGTKSASPQVDSTLMNDQLASAPRIPQDVKARHKEEEAPPSAGFDAANTEAMGSGAGAVGSVFSGQARSTVKYVPPPPIVVPVEVAETLLIHKTLPSYPPGAWNHYASGKVVLEAIVSEAGSVENLKVVSGPPEFQQAALDAVKTWRYKPYVVNDKPARVQTKVTLIFDPYKK